MYKSLLTSSSCVMPLLPAVVGKSTANYVVQLRQAGLPTDSRCTMPNPNAVTWFAWFERITRFPHDDSTDETDQDTLPEQRLPPRTFFLKLNYVLNLPQPQFHPVAR